MLDQELKSSAIAQNPLLEPMLGRSSYTCTIFVIDLLGGKSDNFRISDEVLEQIRKRVEGAEDATYYIIHFIPRDFEVSSLEDLPESEKKKVREALNQAPFPVCIVWV